uniref:substrate-binding periplasmic protein n=1 Tax=Castellaniella defragrans TaxID=75697 RepID=UPI00334146BC
MKRLGTLASNILRTWLVPLALTMALVPAAHAQLWQSVQQRGTLRCAAPLYPPLVIKDPKTQEYSGVYLDLCREFGEQVLGVKVAFVDTTWDNIIAGLQSGKWDISPALNHTPKRALAVRFSTSASYSELDVVYDPKNPKMQNVTTALESLDQPDITFGVVSGTAHDHTISRRLKQARIMRLPSIDEVRLALLSRRVDATVDEVDTNRIFLMQYPGRFASVNPVPALQKQGMGFGLPHQTSSADTAVLDIFINEKVALGEVDELFKRYSQQIIDQSKQ